MFSFNKLPINRASRELRNSLKRQISKTSSAPNSDAVSRKDGQLGVNADLKPFSNVRAANDKWTIHSKHNNSRALSTIQTKVLPNVSNAPFATKEESREFMAIFPDIVRDLTDAGRHTDIPEVTKRFAHVLQYNVPNGKKTRGLTTVIAYKMLEKPENLTPENIRLANILGWCVELLKAFGVVADDLIDHSETRHNMACWYKYEDVGMTAVNDSSLLEQSVFHVLKKYLSNRPHYASLIELFQDTTLKSAMGKSLDCEITNDLTKMTMKNYSLISKYRNGYCTLQLPVAAAMYLAEMSDPEQHRQAQTLLLEMGHYFQVQKDFLNCFGSSESITNIGSDVNEGKCTWLAVVALQRASPSQREVMEEFYGKSGEKAVHVIRNLFVELGLPATYERYEEQTNKIIMTNIQQLTRGLPHKLFFTILRELYTFE
uniref:Farnesyl pyrophosphate synthase n=1 Tax=Phyllotreta striolata TaxID=444603 RepID=A0A140AZ55_PHYSR|nr:isopentenyl diphosphate synthase [Phyllotreta striolata]